MPHLAKLGILQQIKLAQLVLKQVLRKNATVGKDQTVELVAGDNLTINQDERKFTYSLE